MTDYDALVKALREHRGWALNETLDAAADAIEELLQKEKFHAFLWNVINPNDMQLYLEMYHSGEEKQEAKE